MGWYRSKRNDAFLHVTVSVPGKIIAVPRIIAPFVFDPIGFRTEQEFRILESEFGTPGVLGLCLLRSPIFC